MAVDASNGRTTNTAASTQYNLAFLSAVGAGSTLFCTVRVGNSTASITNVSDSVNGNWTLVEGPDNASGATNRAFSYIFENSGAGTPTVTVDLSESVGGSLAICEVTGGTTTGNPDNSDPSPLTFTTTAAASNALAISGAGGFVGYIITAGSVTLSATGNDVSKTVATGSLRAHITFSAAGSATSHTHSATLSTSSNGAYGIVAFLEAGGGGGPAATYPGYIGGGWW
jgi:hypothetical protein